MISRLTASAALFAVFATAGIAFAADTQQRTPAQQVAPAASMPMLTLPRVEITGKRQPRS